MNTPRLERPRFCSRILADLVRRTAARGRAAAAAGLLALPLAGMAAEDPGELVQGFTFDEDTVLQTSHPVIRGDVLYVTTGFFLRMQDRVLLGDALRWDQATDEIFATGRVVLSQPGLRIAAEGIGFRRLQRGADGKAVGGGRIPLVAEAWNARVRLVMPESKEQQRIVRELTEFREQRARLEERLAATADEKENRRLAAGREELDERIEALEAQRKPSGSRVIRLSCERLTLKPDRIELRGVTADGGHGAMLGFHTPLMVVGLRDEEATDRKGIKRHVEDVLVANPNFRIIGIPFFWLPLVYRDFRLDYPWTRFEFGRGDRQGVFVRSWVGMDLPNGCPCRDPERHSRVTRQLDRSIAAYRLEHEPDLPPQVRAALEAQVAGPAPIDPEEHLPRWYDLHGRVEGRFDHHVKAGSAGGGRARWLHHDLGRGQFVWYGNPHETIYSPRGWPKALAKGPLTPGRALGATIYAEGDSRPPVATLERHTYDAEHAFSFTGGGGYLRYTSIPDPDPYTPDVLDPLYLYNRQDRRPADDRFRNDYLREDVETRPLAQQGGALAWSTAALTLVGDASLRPHPWSRETERLAGFAAGLPPLKLLGPFHLGGEAAAAKLRRRDVERLQPDATWSETEADRLRYDGHLTGTRWLGGLGLDATGGVRGLVYDDAEYTRYRREWYDPVYGPYSHYYDVQGLQPRQHEELGSKKEIDRREADLQFRNVPYLEGGLRLRFRGTWGDEAQYRHVFAPRLGVELAGDHAGTGDSWERFDFFDGGDRLVSDRRFLTAGLTTSVAKGSRNVFSGSVTSRWGLREEDRSYQRRLGPLEEVTQNLVLRNYNTAVENWIATATPTWPVGYRDLYTREFKRLYVTPGVDRFKEDLRRSVADSHLVAVDGRVSFTPGPALSFTGSASYDALLDRFDALSIAAEWIPHERLRFRYQAVYLPERLVPNAIKEVVNTQFVAIDPLLAIDTYDELPEEWQHTIGGTLVGNRYRLDAEVYLRPKGAGVDGFKVTVSRKLVDGTVGVTYELSRDATGNITDHSFGVEVSLYGLDVF